MARIFADKLDIPLIIASLSLIGMSLLTLASGNAELFTRQLVWLVAAVLLMVGLPFLNLRAFFIYRWVILGIYLSLILLLIITYFVAPIIAGARSWLVIGPIQLQPSEFIKAGLIILFSSFFAVRHIAIARLGIITTSFIYLLIPTILVLLQPDLGTVLVLVGIWFGYLLVSGMPTRFIAAALILFIVVGALGWQFGLADYQKARIGALFTPSADQLGVNYSVAQSKIAIGSAGVFGKGFKQGTQVQLGFLPAAQTDFIFASFVEEWGLLGGFIMISTFIFLLYRILKIGTQSINNFARFIALGTAIMLFIHFVINLGSTLGLLPVIGIGFPLVSYGGSNLLTIAVLIGILQGTALKRGGY